MAPQLRVGAVPILQPLSTDSQLQNVESQECIEKNTTFEETTPIESYSKIPWGYDRKDDIEEECSETLEAKENQKVDNPPRFQTSTALLPSNPMLHKILVEKLKTEHDCNIKMEPMETDGQKEEDKTVTKNDHDAGPYSAQLSAEVDICDSIKSEPPDMEYPSLPETPLHFANLNSYGNETSVNSLDAVAEITPECYIKKEPGEIRSIDVPEESVEKVHNIKSEPVGEISIDVPEQSVEKVHNIKNEPVGEISIDMPDGNIKKVSEHNIKKESVEIIEIICDNIRKKPIEIIIIDDTPEESVTEASKCTISADNTALLPVEPSINTGRIIKSELPSIETAKIKTEIPDMDLAVAIIPTETIKKEPSEAALLDSSRQVENIAENICTKISNAGSSTINNDDTEQPNNNPGSESVANCEDFHGERDGSSFSCFQQEVVGNLQRYSSNLWADGPGFPIVPKKKKMIPNFKLYFSTNCNEDCKPLQICTENHIHLSFRNNKGIRKQIEVKPEDPPKIIRSLEKAVSKIPPKTDCFEPILGKKLMNVEYLINDENYRRTLLSSCSSVSCESKSESNISFFSLSNKVVPLMSNHSNMERNLESCRNFEEANTSSAFGISSEMANFNSENSSTLESHESLISPMSSSGSITTLSPTKCKTPPASKELKSLSKRISNSSPCFNLLPGTSAELEKPSTPDITEFQRASSAEFIPENSYIFHATSNFSPEPAGLKLIESQRSSYNMEPSNISVPFNLPAKIANSNLESILNFSNEELKNILDSVKVATASNDTSVGQNVHSGVSSLDRALNGKNTSQKYVQVESTNPTFYKFNDCQQEANPTEAVACVNKEIDNFLYSCRIMSSKNQYKDRSSQHEVKKIKRTSTEASDEHSKDPRLKRSRSQSSNTEPSVGEKSPVFPHLNQPQIFDALRNVNVASNIHRSRVSSPETFLSSPSVQESTDPFTSNVDWKSNLRNPERQSFVSPHLKEDVSGIKTEDFIKTVCDWSVELFDNQPPTPPNLNISQVQERYASYLEYYRTYSTVLLFEVWQKILKSWSCLKTIKLTNNSFQIREICPESFSIQCERIIAPRDHHWKENRLVVATFTTLSNKTLRMLALIRKSEQRSYHPNYDIKQPSLIEYSGVLPLGSLKKIKLDLFVSQQCKDVNTAKAVTFQIISNLQKYIRQHKALLNLSCTELCDAILCPIAENSKVMSFYTFSSSNDSGKSDIKEIGAICSSPNDKKLVLVNVPSPTDPLLILCAIIQEIKQNGSRALICVKNDESLEPLYHALMPEYKQVAIPSRTMTGTSKEFRNDCIDPTEFLKKERRQRYLEKIQQCNVLLTVIQSSTFKYLVSHGDLKPTCCIVNEAHRFTETELLIALMFNINKLLLLGVLKRLRANSKDLSCNDSVFHRAFWNS